MPLEKHTLILLLLALAAPISHDALAKTPHRVIYALDAQASGVTETIDNIVNLTVVSKDGNDLKAEYRAGFVQGRLQARGILSARDNAWNLSYLTDPTHAFPRQPVPARDELERAARLLKGNYNATIQYIKAPSTDPDVAQRLKRLLFRMVGVYHGASIRQPAALDFSGAWLPDESYFKESELGLGYETPTLSFMDVYYVNAYNDLGDILAHAKEAGKPAAHPEKCSAFLKRTGKEVILTHNSWMGFLSQTMNMTLAINKDLMTVNAATPGLIGSATDFGFNNKGMMFNETTHRMDRSEVKPDGLWIFWRAALAEQFSASIDDFFRAISLDNSGTYLNGYMLVDAKNNETGLVEMSYRCFVYYRSNGGPYTVTSKSLDGQPCSTQYDPEMVTPDYLMGINYPASLQVRTDLLSTDNRPARRRQFAKLFPGVVDVSTAKAAITYTDPANPLSVFGRWDLGYGETAYPKMIPDGSIDAKAGDTAMVRSFMRLSGKLDMRSKATGFWMLYGTPTVDGAPFVWSQSSWKWQKRRDVPDRLEGAFTLMPLHLR
ncbi:MAG: hypothetical protein ACLPGW_07560 [Roseiarcus sp.]